MDSESAISVSEETRTKPVGLVSGVRRIVYITGAGLFFVLGVLGAILPGLPATPFLLLTSYFLIRTSPKWNNRLLQSRFFGPILRDWQQRGGVTRRIKYQALAIVIMAVGLTLWLSPLPAIFKGGVAGLAAVGVVVVIRLPEVGQP